MKKYAGNTIYLYFVKTWLITILLVLPFQMKIATFIAPWSNKAATIINNLDELTIVIFLLLSLREYYVYRKHIENKQLLLFLFIPLVLLTVCGWISGTVNGNSFFITLLGSFDYIKHFLAIFIYAAFFRERSEFIKIFRILLVLASFLGIVALAQFLWAMGSVYVFGKDITDPAVYIFVNKSYYDPSLLGITWRYGIYRAPSLTYHAYIPGLYCLLLFTLFSYTSAKRKIMFSILLMSGIIASVSRMAYTGLIFVLTLRIFKERKTVRLALSLFLSITVVLALHIYTSEDYNYSGTSGSSNPPEAIIMDPANIDSGDKLRSYTRGKSLEIWRDHPVWGVGPGMFGGIIASKYGSTLYSDYHLRNEAYLVNVGGIEQFWFQLIAEAGIVGVIFFGSLFITLFVILDQLEKQEVSKNMKGFFSAQKIFIGCILIYSLGSSINIAPILFTYCALLGIGIGCNRTEPYEVSK